MASWWGGRQNSGESAVPSSAVHPQAISFGFVDRGRGDAQLSVTAGTNDAVLHVYGGRREQHSAAGEEVSPDHLLDLISELFYAADVDERHSLDKRKLQLVLHCLNLAHKPSEVFRNFGSYEGALQLEELVLFISTTAKERQSPLKLIVTPSLLREVREGYERLETRNGRPLLHELEILVAQLGLDMEKKSCETFLEGRRLDSLSFMLAFVRELQHGIASGEKTLAVRNWFPGAWYVRDRHSEGPSVLHLYLENSRGRWTDMGKVLSAGLVESQSLLISLRTELHGKMNMLLARMEPSHALVFAQAAAPFAPPGLPHGVLSHEAAVELVNRITGANNLKNVSRREIVENMFTIVAGDGVDAVEIDELIVVLKLLGQHTEPEHISYLLSRAPQERLGSMEVPLLVDIILTLDVRDSVPVPTILKLKDAFTEADLDGDSALNMVELRDLTHRIGLKWTTKDIVRVLGLATSKFSGIALIDFVQFMDAIVEAYGDPHYRLRYRDLFDLMDADHGGSLSDDEVIPFLLSAGLDDASAQTALMRLLGGHISLDFEQFATAMFEEEMVGESFPAALLVFARAFSNFDAYNEFPSPITKESLTVLLRKLGYKFSEADRNDLFKLMDASSLGIVHFRDFVNSFALAERDSNNRFSFYNVAALANTTSYELTSTVQELDELRDTSGRPRLERLAVELLAKDARRAARAQDLEATLTARPIQGALDTEMGDEERSALRPMMILKVTLICWFAILRSGMFGLGAGGCAVAFQSLAKKVYKAELPDGTSRPPAWGDWHFYAYWVINGLLPTIVSFAESILIYFDLLKVSLAVAATSGIKLYPLDPVRVFVCNSIVAEVFELGHPSEPRFGINPLRGSNEYILKLYEMLYSLRGGALKFIIKLLFKKVATRSALRGSASGFGDWLTISIGGYMDASASAVQLHAIRVVALGRTCIVPIVDVLLGVHQEIADHMALGTDIQKAVSLVKTKSFVLSSTHNSFDQQRLPMEMKTAILRAVAVAVVQSKVFHPNLELLMKHLMYRLRIDPAKYKDLDDESKFINQILPKLNSLDQYTVLTFLAFSVCLDGNLSIAQKINLKVAMTACNLMPSIVGLREISDKYQKQMLTPEDVAFVFYKVRDKEEGNDDITFMERVESALADIMRALAL